MTLKDTLDTWPTAWHGAVLQLEFGCCGPSFMTLVLDYTAYFCLAGSYD